MRAVPGFALIAIGVSVMVGWFVESHLLTAWGGGGVVTTKFATAQLVLLSGLMMVFLRLQSNRSKGIGVGAAIVVVAQIMLLIADYFGGGRFGLHEAFVAEPTSEAVMSRNPGEPSVCTLLGFFALAFAGICYATEFARAAMVCFGLAGFAGLVTLAGHLFGWDTLTCWFTGSTAVARPTAVALVVGAWGGLTLTSIREAS